MSWYTVSMSPGDVSSQKHVSIQDAFEVLFMANRAPRDAAMFAASTPGNPNYEVYFSPVAASLASVLLASYGGQACMPPTVPLSLLVGHADAKEHLLP
jgi:hypothetical protein